MSTPPSSLQKARINESSREGPDLNKCLDFPLENCDSSSFLVVNRDHLCSSFYLVWSELYHENRLLHQSQLRSPGLCLLILTHLDVTKVSLKQTPPEFQQTLISRSAFSYPLTISLISQNSQQGSSALQTACSLRLFSILPIPAQPLLETRTHVAQVSLDI